MNPEFVTWANDLTFKDVCMYANGYGRELAEYWNAQEYEEEWLQIQTFQDWLMDCFNREHGEKIQGENKNGN